MLLLLHVEPLLLLLLLKFMRPGSCVNLLLLLLLLGFVSPDPLKLAGMIVNADMDVMEVEC